MRYGKLFLMGILSYISMYILMYIMVDSYANAYINLNNAYMAGIMTIPMLIIELFVMRSMYDNKKINFSIIVISLLIFTLLIICIRRQIGITDREFLKSMIPHHSSALLMCKNNHLQNPAIKKLCESIDATQQAEINFMRSKLQALQK